MNFRITAMPGNVETITLDYKPTVSELLEITGLEPVKHPTGYYSQRDNKLALHDVVNEDALVIICKRVYGD